MEKKFGIIDMGSNSIRLVIYIRKNSGIYEEILNVKNTAKLSNYLGKKRIISQKGIQILLATLFRFQEITRFYGLDKVICVATAALRAAENRKFILSKIKTKTDFSFRVLSGPEEAQYGYLAVINSTSMDEGITVDIGGGSTDIALFSKRKIKEVYSFPFGALTLKKQFVSGTIPTQKELSHLSQFLMEQFQSLPWLINSKVPVIGIGGSARNMVQIDQYLKDYSLGGLHQYTMELEDISSIKEYLSALNEEEIQQVNGLSKDRTDTIIPAILCFEKIYESVSADQFVLSRKGLRDGILYEQMLKPFQIDKIPSVIEDSLNEFVVDFQIDLEHAHQVARISELLFKEIHDKADFTLNSDDFLYLRRAAHLFYLGEFIDSESSSQHTFYMLSNSSIDGLFHKERLKLALLASFKSKSNFNRYISDCPHWFNETEQTHLLAMGAMLKLSHCLNYTKRKVVDSIKLKKTDKYFELHVTCNKDYYFEKLKSEKQIKHLEKGLNQKIRLCFNELD